MAGCCDDNCAVEALQERQRGTLLAVLGINAVMFVVMILAAYAAGSTALLADSLDNLGDALTYGLSLLVVSGTALMKARVALFKGVLIAVATLLLAGQIVYRLLVPAIPVFELMGVFSVIALVGNGCCLALLWRHREEDINMSSVWECSRNDIAGNLSVFLAAGLVWLTASGWPDLIVATGLMVLLLRSAVRVVSSARTEIASERSAMETTSDGIVMEYQPMTPAKPT